MKKNQNLLLLTLTVAMLTGCTSGASKIYQVSTVSLPKEQIPPKLSNRDESVMVYSEWFARTYGFPLSGVDRTLPQGVEALELQIVVNHNDPLRVNKAYGLHPGECNYNIMLRNVTPSKSGWQTPPKTDRWHAGLKNRVAPFKGIAKTTAHNYAYYSFMQYGPITGYKGSTTNPFFNGPHKSFVTSQKMLRNGCLKHSQYMLDGNINYFQINTVNNGRLHIKEPVKFAHFIQKQLLSQ